MLFRSYKGSTPLVVLACAVQDPGNLGAIIRSAEAAGATGLVAVGPCADPYGWKAIRGSMGSALRLPVVSERLVPDALAAVDRYRCRLLGATPAGGVPYSEVDMTGPLAIAIGSEGLGLPPEVLLALDARVTIPMRPPVESLNTAITAALLLYEAARQRPS